MDEEPFREIYRNSYLAGAPVRPMFDAGCLCLCALWLLGIGALMVSKVFEAGPVVAGLGLLLMAGGAWATPRGPAAVRQLLASCSYARSGRPLETVEGRPRWEFRRSGKFRLGCMVVGERRFHLWECGGWRRMRDTLKRPFLLLRAHFVPATGMLVFVECRPFSRQELLRVTNVIEQEIGEVRRASPGNAVEEEKWRNFRVELDGIRGALASGSPAVAREQATERLMKLDLCMSLARRIGAVGRERPKVP